MQARWLLTLTLALIALAGCGGESAAATLAGPLNYHRSGGFGGEVDDITIQRDGRARSETRRGGKRSFKLRKADLDRVAALVRDADLARVKVRKSRPANDLFYYSIAYRGRKLEFDDLTIPEPVSELVGALDSIVRRYAGGAG